MDFKEFIGGNSMIGVPSKGGDVSPSWEKSSNKQKPWKAKRADVISFWQRLKPNLPLKVNPIDPNHRGTRFHEDGLRITGSPEFINSILSRIKDFLGYDSQNSKLDVEYRSIENKEGDLINKPVFVAYVHVLKKKPEQSRAKLPTAAELPDLI